jgi:hypothetical protein
VSESTNNASRYTDPAMSSIDFGFNRGTQEEIIYVFVRGYPACLGQLAFDEVFFRFYPVSPGNGLQGVLVERYRRSSGPEDKGS